MNHRSVPLPPHFTTLPVNMSLEDAQGPPATRDAAPGPTSTKTGPASAQDSDGSAEGVGGAEQAQSSATHLGLQDEEHMACCCVCTEPLELVAVGCCGHAETCARCCLKTRLNYHNTRCPVCAVEQAAVLIAPWRQRLPAPPRVTPAGRPTKAALRQYGNKLSWAPGVLVTKTQWCATLRLMNQRNHAGHTCQNV